MYWPYLLLIWFVLTTFGSWWAFWKKDPYSSVGAVLLVTASMYVNPIIIYLGDKTRLEEWLDTHSVD